VVTQAFGYQTVMSRMNHIPELQSTVKKKPSM